MGSRLEPFAAVLAWATKPDYPTMPLCPLRDMIGKTFGVPNSWYVFTGYAHEPPVIALPPGWDRKVLSHLDAAEAVRRGLPVIADGNDYNTRKKSRGVLVFNEAGEYFNPGDEVPKLVYDIFTKKIELRGTAKIKWGQV